MITIKALYIFFARLHRAMLNQLNRTQKVVKKWLKLCEKKEKNVDVSDVKDLDKAHEEFLKLKVGFETRLGLLKETNFLWI